tara:strand:- start:352 stop:924 length:573 start_codon:yes stop_codon:yes gene_type:complete
MRRDNTERRTTFVNILKEYFPNEVISLEIGCAAGDFSDIIIKTLKIEQHYMVDPWITEGDDLRSQWFSNNNPAEISYNFVLDRFKDKPVTIIREYSKEFLTIAKTNELTFDFIYIDGDHHSVPVYLDLLLSYDLLKPGGILAGDDYNWVSRKTNLQEVKLGVDLFQQKLNLEAKIIKGDNQGLDQYYFTK